MAIFLLYRYSVVPITGYYTGSKISLIVKPIALTALFADSSFTGKLLINLDTVFELTPNFLTSSLFFVVPKISNTLSLKMSLVLTKFAPFCYSFLASLIQQAYNERNTDLAYVQIRSIIVVC